MNDEKINVFGFSTKKFLENKKEYAFISTPIYYANGKPHIGHYYTCLVADAISKSIKILNNKTFVSTGTDEHGQKIMKTAESIGVTPQNLVDTNSENFINMMREMDFEFDKFIRTTSEDHKKGVLNLWKKLEQNNQIYIGKYSGWYSLREEAFYQEKDIVNGKSPFGEKLEYVEEEGYFFRLSNWESKLLELYDTDFILPKNRKNEIESFVKSGLKDISISRKNINWGIKITETDTIYVWIDALSNYITTLGYPQKTNEYESFWNNKESSLFPLHIVGKDILRFHAVYWPAILMAAELPLPKKILAHGWWLNEGQKMSKSLNNAIDYKYLMKKFGKDATRFFFLRESSFSADGSFSEKLFAERVNSELLSNFGNLVNRTLKMVSTYFNNTMCVESNSISLEVKKEIEHSIIYFKDSIKEFQIQNIVKKALDLSSFANKLIDEKTPWKLYKEKKQKELMQTLFEVTKIIHLCSVMLWPTITSKTELVFDYISAKKDFEDVLERKKYTIKNNFDLLFTKIESEI